MQESTGRTVEQHRAGAAGALGAGDLGAGEPARRRASPRRAGLARRASAAAARRSTVRLTSIIRDSARAWAQARAGGRAVRGGPRATSGVVGLEHRAHAARPPTISSTTGSSEPSPLRRQHGGQAQEPDRVGDAASRAAASRQRGRCGRARGRASSSAAVGARAARCARGSRPRSGRVPVPPSTAAAPRRRAAGLLQRPRRQCWRGRGGRRRARPLANSTCSGPTRANSAEHVERRPGRRVEEDVGRGRSRSSPIAALVGDRRVRQDQARLGMAVGDVGELLADARRQAAAGVDQHRQAALRGEREHASSRGSSTVKACARGCSLMPRAPQVDAALGLGERILVEARAARTAPAGRRSRPPSPARGRWARGRPARGRARCSANTNERCDAVALHAVEVRRSRVERHAVLVEAEVRVRVDDRGVRRKLARRASPVSLEQPRACS